MSINKDLNVDPYYDDFDETKQFNRVLFKPSKAVQARELTQLQTILQKQVERFGSNVYKEGTIISGVNLTARDDLNYIKLQDQVGFTNPEIYDEFEITDTNDTNFGSTSRFILEGQSTGIRAEIVKGLGGFETQAPNLKTFFINYLNAGTNSTDGTAIKQFASGEKLNLLKPDNGSGVFEQVQVDGVNVTFTTDNSNTTDYAGKSFGVSCEEGVIYQKGHFIFVERQLIIVTRYSDVPGKGMSTAVPYNAETISDVSVGFTIKENIIDSNLDNSLLDNATGFNNQNAPGADRLQLVPTLNSFATESEPEEFFALIRYVNGNAVRIRNYTEFNVIGDEIARRTYEESGNYVVNGLNCSLERNNNNTQVSISPGKAYVYGREITNVSTKKLNIDGVQTTKTLTGQGASVNYGQYYTFNSANGQNVVPFQFQWSETETEFKYPKYALYNGTTKIGTCNIANVTPGEIYVFNLSITTESSPTHLLLDSLTSAGGFDINTALKVALTNSGELFEQSRGSYIFDTGQLNVNAITNTSVVERVKTENPVTLTTNQAGQKVGAITPASESNVMPIADVNTIFGITSANQIYTPTAVQQDSGATNFTGMTVTFGATVPTSDITIYYNQLRTGVASDTLDQRDGFVYTKYSNALKMATLGVPNAIELESVSMTTSEGTQTPDVEMVDVTSRFRLVNNQKDTHYDISYIQLKSGQEGITNDTILLVKFKYLNRTENTGILTASSYSSDTISRSLIQGYTTKRLDYFNLFNCYDMRPYKKIFDGISPFTPGNNRSNALSQRGPDSTTLNVSHLSSTETVGRTLFSSNSTINSTYNYTLSRRDSVVVDEYGEISIFKGDESELPKAPQLDRMYPIATIHIPGNTTAITGEHAVMLLDKKNKTYTMKDIEELEMKVESLSNLVSLSLSEMNAKSLIITDADGNERFKNGILVDKFNNLDGAQMFDPDFNAAIDESRTIAMPAIREFPIDLKPDLTQLSNVSTEADGFDDVITLVPDAQKINIINQPYATNFRSCVSNYYSYQGQADIYPKFSSNRDVIQNPAVNFDIDLAGPLNDLVEGLQEFIPLTKEEVRIGQPRILDSFVRREVVGRTNRGRNITRRVRTSTFSEKVESSTLTSTPRTEEQTFGNFVTDVRMKPYLPATAIRIFVAGLRPNTRHYFFFDEQDVNADIVPIADLSKYNSVSRKGGARYQTGRYRFRSNRTERNVKGTAVYSNSKGQLRAVFDMPAGKYFVGENDLEIVDVDQYGSIESASTSYAKATYRGYNFALNKSEINVTTRTVDFDVSTNIIERQFQVKRVDPIAQTFRVRSGDTDNARFAYLSDIDVYFKRKDNSVGATLQVREVLNGYPTSKVLPFASKHLESSQVSSSAQGTVPTKFVFDNPVKVKADMEYCFVVIPDGNSPEYLIFTSKVGSTSLSKGTVASQLPVVNDWGDGVLFTSTNDSAWKSYQDEDLKFSVNRYNFSLPNGTVNLIPNDMEFLTIRDNIKEATADNLDSTTGLEESRRTRHFQNDEPVYILPSAGGATPGRIGGDELTVLNVDGTFTLAPDGSVSSSDFPFTDGDYLYIEDTNDSDEKIIAQIESFSQGADSSTDIVIDTPFFSAGSVAVKLCVFGEVSYYNPRQQSKVHLKNSSARSGNYIDNLSPTAFSSTAQQGFTVGKTYTITALGSGDVDALQTAWSEVGVSGVPAVGVVFVATNQTSATYPTHNGFARENSHVIYGINSGAQATVTITDEEKISYFQSEVLVDDTMNTFSSIKDLTLDKPINKNTNVYCLENVKSIKSKSERLRTGAAEDFVIQVALANNGFSAVSPVVDAELSSINAYQYKITSNDDTTSTWVSKEVILKDDLPAEGLRVNLSAYRPAGTVIDVYSRYVRRENSDVKTDWIRLGLSNPDEYSTKGRLNDYRDFEYNLDESQVTQSYNTFQVKIVMRHNTTGAGGELNNPELEGVVPDINLFPHIFSYTAIAVSG